MRTLFLLVSIIASSTVAFGDDFSGQIIAASRIVTVRDNSGKLTDYRVPDSLDQAQASKGTVSVNAGFISMCSGYLGQLAHPFLVVIRNGKGEEQEIHVPVESEGHGFDVFGNCKKDSTVLEQLAIQPN